MEGLDTSRNRSVLTDISRPTSMDPSRRWILSACLSTRESSQNGRQYGKRTIQTGPIWRRRPWKNEQAHAASSLASNSNSRATNKNTGDLIPLYTCFGLWHPRHFHFNDISYPANVARDRCLTFEDWSLHPLELDSVLSDDLVQNGIPFL